MNNALERLKKNLKDYPFDLYPKYGIDKNEAAEIIKEIEAANMEGEKKSDNDN